MDNSSHLDVCHQSVNLEICAGYFLFGPVLSAVAGGIFKRSIELFTNLHPPAPRSPCPQGVYSPGLHGGKYSEFDWLLVIDYVPLGF